LDFYEFGAMIASLLLGIMANSNGRRAILLLSIVGQTTLCVSQSSVLIYLFIYIYKAILTKRALPDAGDAGYAKWFHPHE
jgi:MFS family permease